MSSGITALGSLAIIAGGLGALVWYANRAGRNAASVSEAQADITAANQVTSVTQAMADAAARTITDDDLMAAMKEGKA